MDDIQSKQYLNIKPYYSVCTVNYNQVTLFTLYTGCRLHIVRYGNSYTVYNHYHAVVCEICAGYPLL